MKVQEAIFIIASLSPGCSATFTGSFEGILWKGGFETSGHVRQEYNEIVGNPPPGRTKKTSSSGGFSPRCGNQFLEVNIDGSDTAYNHNRVEIGFHPTDQVPEKMDDTVRYYGWSMAHDVNNPISSDSTYELAYWEAKTVWAQTIGFYISDGKTLKLRTRGSGADKDIGSMDFPPGRWHDFVMGIKWSGGAGGWVQLWKDGKEVIKKTPHQTLKWTGNPDFSHLGIFRIPKVSTKVRMFYDCTVYAKTYNPSEADGCYDDSASMKTCKTGQKSIPSGGTGGGGSTSMTRRRSAPGPPPGAADGPPAWLLDRRRAPAPPPVMRRRRTPAPPPVLRRRRTPPPPPPPPPVVRRRRRSPPPPPPAPPPPVVRRRRRAQAPVTARRRRRRTKASAGVTKAYVDNAFQSTKQGLADLEEGLAAEFESIRGELEGIQSEIESHGEENEDEGHNEENEHDEDNENDRWRVAKALFNESKNE